MKPILCGMNNPVSNDPEHSLWPQPPGCAGHRLAKMLCDVSMIGRGAYIKGFDRRNLLVGRWVPTAAREAAQLFEHEQTEAEEKPAAVVLLGNDVRDAFRHAPRLVHGYRRGGVTYRQVPHPSGRNPWYNDPDHRLVVGLMLEELLCWDR